MTRISAGIRAKELCDAHLRKERVEILRIPNKIKNGKAKNFDAPKEYKLGTGHELFFRNKLKYLHYRYLELTAECKRRGFETTDFSDAFNNLPQHLYNDWQETKEARVITKGRIEERLRAMKDKDLKYYKEQKTAEQLILLIQ